MSKTYRVFIVDQVESYAKAFDPERFTIVDDFEDDVDIVCFTGGVDVDPAMYGEPRYEMTNTPDNSRELHDSYYFDLAVERGIPMVGICRGSQFLCVKSGGKLVQHISNHALYGTHEMLVRDVIIPYTVNVTSTHHQMQYPFNLPENHYEIIACAELLSDKYEGIPEGFDMDALAIEGEPEVVYYTKTKALGVQGHPEYVVGSEFWIWFNHTVLDYLTEDNNYQYGY